ncbi:hypothetical protein ABW20_dc0103315 [Dactylellina cionopaga]|nr:hypothetical protein ABW20_dc0103315 [Dactylellina cionopaga]
MFVDALDECGEDEVRKVIAYLEDLSVTATASEISLNICLSSRHYPTITMRKHLELVVESQAKHNDDIAIYVKEKVRTNDIYIELELCRRAEGIFLWVVLVVELVNRAFDEGDITAVRQRLGEVPSGLDEVFVMLLEKDNPRKQETLLILQWMLFAQRSMSSKELYYAVITGTRPDDLGPWDESRVTAKVVGRFITSTSRGLIEVKMSPFQSLAIAICERPLDSVQFIHETVRDFLLRNKRLLILEPSLGPDIIGASHEKLANCCLFYFTMGCLGKLMAECKDIKYNWEPCYSVTRKYPFLNYASVNFLKHTKDAQANNMDVQNLFKCHRQNPELFRRLKAGHEIVLLESRATPYDSESTDATLLSSLVLEIHPSLVQAFLKEDTNVYAGSGSFGSSLQAAIHQTIRDPSYSREMVQILVDAGADLDAPGRNGRSALQEAVALACCDQPRAREIVGLLLQAGANVKVQNGGVWGNALHTAIALCIPQRLKLPDLYGRPDEIPIDIVQMLLDAGADANAEGGYYGYALQAAAAYSSCGSQTRKEVIRLLLNADAAVNAQGGHYGNAMQAIAAYSIDYHPRFQEYTFFGEIPMEILETLLGAGAEVNLRGGHYNSVLQAAVASANRCQGWYYEQTMFGSA